MTTDAKDIFLDAIEAPPGDRAALIDRACGGDAALRSAVERLLEAHAADDRFLAQPTLGPASVGGGAPAAMESPGDRIGRYELVRVLGEGGFGKVFLALQREPVRRHAALKLIKPGMDSARVVTRFETERQALALMNHPGIAGVYDAGTTAAGRPFVVMEYVEGEPISAYADRRRLSLEQRIELLTVVCDAVQHAHQRGVIHRDLKPSNVLVASIDGRPAPKIIDFGIAKAVSAPRREGDGPGVTAAHELLGTPQYMSPEQASLSADEIDTRTDVYSLGVMLFELLTGRRPRPDERLRSASPAELERILVEEEATRPSTRVLSAGPGAAEAEAAAAARREPSARSLAKRLRGDLDWITRRALANDRSARYPTAYALASDLRRHLRREPVEAGPPSALYRLNKFVLRHRVLAAAAGLALLLLVGATVVSVAFATLTAHAERRASDLRRLAEARGYVAAMFGATAALGDNDPLTARRLLDETAPELRSWEWRLLAGRIDRAVAVTGPFGGKAWPSAMSPSGELVIGAWGDRRVRVHASRGLGLRLEVGLPEDELPVSVAISPDGRTAYAGGERGRFIAWDVADGAVRFDVPSAHAGRVTHAASSADGRVWTCGVDGDAAVWDGRTGRAILRFEHPGPLWTCRVGPGGTRLATACWDQHLRLWDARTGELLMTRYLAGPDTPPGRIERWSPGRITAVEFSPDGALIAAGAADGSLHLIEAEAGCAVARLDESGVHVSHVRDVAFSPDGARLAAADLDGTATVWDLGSRRLLGVLSGHRTDARDIAFHPSGRYVITASRDHTVMVWDVELFESAAVLHGHENIVYRAHLGPDGRTLVSESQDGTLRSWDVTGAVAGRMVEDGSVFQAAFDPRGGRLAVGNVHTAGRVWDVASGRPVFELRHPGRGVTGVAYSPTGDVLASAGFGGEVLLWDPDAGAPFGVLQGHRGRALAIAFSPDGRLIATGGADGVVVLWRREDLSEAARLEGHDSTVETLAFTPDGRTLVSAGFEGLVRAWDVGSRRRLWRWSSPTAEVVRSVSVCPRGEVVCVGAARRIVMLDVADGRELAVGRGHAGQVSGLAWLPDRSRLLSVAADGTLRVWTPEDLVNVASFRAHRREARAIAVSSDGRRVATGGEDRRVYVWSAEAGGVVQDAR